MAYWLKLLGTSKTPLPADWTTTRSDALQHSQLSRRSTMQAGDSFVYYAPGAKRVIAIGEFVTAPKMATRFPAGWDDDRKRRWPWAIEVKIAIAIPCDDRAPTLEDIGVNPSSVRQQSYVRLSAQQFEAAAHAVERIAKSGR